MLRGLQTTQTQGFPAAISAGTQSGSSGTIVFSNSNGVTFGMSGSRTITASVAAGGGAGFTAGNSNLGNTQGDTGVVTGRLVLVGSNNITLSGSTNAGSMTVSISGAAGGGGGSPNISAGTTSNNLGTVVFSNSNGISFGLNGSTVTGSVATSLTNVNVSAGTTSNNLSALTFSNANGVSFGLNASTLTGSVATSLTNINVSAGTTSNNLSALTFSNVNGVSFGLNASTVTASVAAQTVESNTLGMSNLGNTSGTSGVVSAAQVRYLFAGGNNVTLSQSLNGASGTVTISAFNQSVQTQNFAAVAAGTQTATSGTAVFSNSNGISFGMSNSSVVTASYTVPTVTAGSDTLGISNLGNTSGTSGVVSGDSVRVLFAGGNNVTLSQSLDAGNRSATITISAFNQSVQTQSLINLAAGTQTATSGTVVFSNSNGISFGMSNSSIVTASYTVPTVTAGSDTAGISNLGNTAGTSGVASGDSIRILFAGGNNVTLSQSLDAGNRSATVTISAFNQSVQTQNCVAKTLAGNSTSAGAGYILVSSGTMTIAGGNNITLSQNGNAVTISGANIGGAQTGISSIAASGGTQTAGMVSFVNSNGITFGMSTGAVTGSITASIVAQTAESNTLGMSNLGNTSGTTGVVSAAQVRFLFAGGNNITLSQSLNGASGTITISGANVGGAQTGISGISAGTTLATSGTVVFSNSNGVSFGVNGNTVTASIATGVTNVNVSAGTTSNNLTALTFSNSNGVSFGLNASTVTASVATSLTNINVSAGTTSNNLSALTFSNVNGVSFGLNASTVTASVASQTVDTLGAYFVGTTGGQSSSTTVDARSVSFSGFGPQSLGASGGSLIVSLAGALYCPMHAFLGGV
jgi:fibronectin-binding autotransporter adhesin